MKKIYTDEMTLSILPKEAQLAVYNSYDVMLTREIFDVTSKLLDETTKATYDFSKALQGPVLDMELRGILVDQAALSKLTTEFRSNVDLCEAILEDIVAASGYHDAEITKAKKTLKTIILKAEPETDFETLFESMSLSARKTFIRLAKKEYDNYKKILKCHSAKFNARSATEKPNLLYNYLGIKAIEARSTTTGKMRPTTNRVALEKISELGHEKTPRSKYFWTRPITSLILEVMDASKALGFLKTPLEDGRFKYSFSIAGTDTGRFSSRDNAQGKGQNAQNVQDRLRRPFIAEPGRKIAYIDLEQAESRTVGAICFTLFGAKEYLLIQEAGDPHSLVCSMIWPELPGPKDFSIDYIHKHGSFPKELLLAAKKVAGQKYYREMSYRDLAKRAAHAFNYRGSAKTVASHLKIPTNISENFQAAYFEAFPEIPRWHQNVATQIQTKREITTLLGRKRIFFERPYDDTTLRAAIAFEPQSVATGDYTNRAMLNVWSANLPIHLFLQQHDAIGFTYNAFRETKIIPQVQELMKIEIPLQSPSGESRSFVIPSEALTGWNLAHASKSNPHGLKEFIKKDTRKAPKPTSPFDILNVSF